MSSSSLGFKLSVAGGGTAATASAAAGGLYLSSSGTTTEIEEEPKAKDLVKETKSKPKTQDRVEKVKKQIVAKLNKSPKPSQGSSVDVDSIGYRYYLFLAATTIDSSVDKDTRDSYIEWWNQKYSLWKTDTEDKKDNTFKGITEGFSESASTALNKVCEEVYKQKDPLDPTTSKQYTRTVDNLENNYWRYCSDLDEKPKSLIEASEGAGDNGHVGHYDAYGHLLAATGDQHNIKYWEIKNEWYLSLTTNEIDTAFQTYVTNKGNDVKEKEKVSLRKVCRTTRELNRHETGVTPQLVVKYCGFSEHLFKN